MIRNPPFTLSEIPLSLRLLVTLFLFGMGLGLLDAQLNLALSVIDPSSHRIIPTLNDVKWHFAGNPAKSRLGVAISPGGKMADNLDDQQRQVILDWLLHGHPESEYGSTIVPILNAQCMSRHASADGVRMPHLQPYSEIARIARPGQPMTLGRLALLSHFHFFGMTVFLGLMGLLLWFTRAPEWLKITGMTLPIAGSLLDIIAWWLTALVSPSCALLIYAGGAIRMLGAIPCLLIPLWEMWFRRS